MDSTTTTAPDLTALWHSFQDDGDEDARRILVEKHVGLVRYVAGRLAVGLPHYLEFPDLYGAGLVGLIQAVDNFDRDRGIKFETYAIPRIRGAILDELRSQDWFPRSLRRKARQLETTFATLEARLGRSVSDEEVAQELGMSLDEYDRVLGQISVATLVSLESELHPDDPGGGHRVVDTLVDESVVHPDEVIAQRELRDVIVAALGELTEKERLVLTLYYYEELTLREIGEVLDVTESRVCQIHTKAIFRLKGKVERKVNSKSLSRLGEEVRDALKENVGA
jgi:RNA polymerase sigma factor for flagellar operon FliA